MRRGGAWHVELAEKEKSRPRPHSVRKLDTTHKYEPAFGFQSFLTHSHTHWWSFQNQKSYILQMSISGSRRASRHTSLMFAEAEIETCEVSRKVTGFPLKMRRLQTSAETSMQAAVLQRLQGRASLRGQLGFESRRLCRSKGRTHKPVFSSKWGFLQPMIERVKKASKTF